MSKEYNLPFVVFAAVPGTGIVLRSLTGPSARTDPVPNSRMGTRTTRSRARVSEDFRIMMTLLCGSDTAPVCCACAAPPSLARLVPQLEQRSSHTTALWGRVAPRYVRLWGQRNLCGVEHPRPRVR